MRASGSSGAGALCSLLVVASTVARSHAPVVLHLWLWRRPAPAVPAEATIAGHAPALWVWPAALRAAAAEKEEEEKEEEKEKGKKDQGGDARLTMFLSRKSRVHSEDRGSSTTSAVV